MKKTLSTLFAALSLCASAQTFNIASGGKAADVVTASDEHEAVALAAESLRADIRLAYDGTLSGSNGRRILAGTIGHSALIDSLAKTGSINVCDVRGQWESYVIAPCGRDLVVAGSDRRGTIYGIYELSRRIGVSPWTWWADVPVSKQKALNVSARRYVKASPKVKYRGVFINDEDWGMQTWAAKNYEKELGDIGPKTYARVCELLLRLGGNMLAPAMHDCTGAFYTHPESKVVCDRMGIIITTSHCEPMLFNNFSPEEWNKERDGEWNYRTNRGTILGKFANRVAEAYTYDNIYTIAMRGIHDEGMRGQTSPAERVAVLTDVIRDQRNLLELFTQQAAEDVPQIFVPYKETLDVYEHGLQVPEDVTIVWPDDNYGYMKRLPTPEERKRKGGSGVYYHISYLGAPHDYLWLCSTAPALMYEELNKAYDAGADRYWLLNVGDIKPMELDIQTFFEMADDIKSFDYQRVNTHQAQWLAAIFGQKHRSAMQQILDEYYRLAWSRKPEYMGWEREWDRPDMERLRDTEFSYTNYNDAQRRLSDYHRIASDAKRIMLSLPKEQRPAFFQLLGFSVMAAEQMNRKFLLAQLNHEQHAAGHLAEANWAADQSQAAADSIEALCHTYNTQLDGKWNEMMHVTPGYVAKYHLMPELLRTEGVAPKAVDLSINRAKDALQGCLAIDLTKAKSGIVHGMGYDWNVLHLTNGAVHEFQTGEIPSDSVRINLYALPFFPIYAGHGNAYGVSIDGGEMVRIDNPFKEYEERWKRQVMINGKLSVLTLPIDSSLRQHTLRIHTIDDNQFIERITLDWGGLQPSYIGPAR